jgi:teichuronic acid biosynthesis protein TuaF
MKSPTKNIATEKRTKENEMEVMVRRIAGRSRKYLWLLLVIPILLGGIGWVLPVGKEPSVVRAEATISLGNYQYEEFNHAKNVVTLLTHAPFYQENLAHLVGETGVPSRLTVSAVNEQMIKLVYSDSSADHAANVVNEIAHAFLALDQQTFAEKKLIIEDSITAIEQEQVGEDAKVDQQRFLTEQKTAQFNLKPATLLKEAHSSELVVESQNLSSRDRAVLGVLIGVCIAFLTIVLPELVRKA